jgi:putative phosphoribosyl transferase
MATPTRRSSAGSPVTIFADHAPLPGELAVPRGATGIIVFVHGSGSNRHSPRDRYVARELQGAGFATLLFDLLTPAEERAERTRHLRFDIPLLAARVVRALEWLEGHPPVSHLPVGLFGSNAGAAAALLGAATVRGEGIGAIVARGGRPDLAGDALHALRIPTLLIVGGEDVEILVLNRTACARLARSCALHVVPGATHLFEEPGALEEVAALARDWFVERLSPAGGAGGSV